MNLSVTNGTVETENGASKSPALSSAGSNTGMLVFEDTSDDDSDGMSAFASEEDNDPWMEQQSQGELVESASMESTTLQDLARLPPQGTIATRRNSTYQPFTDIGEGMSSSVRNLGYKEEESLSSPSTTAPFRQGRRATAFAAIVPVGISGDDVRKPSLEAIAQQASTELEEEEDTGPSFREFALLSWSTNKLSLLSDEHIFFDYGHDAFCLDSVDFMDVYPEQASQDSINPKALSRFCFPDGLRIRILPRVCIPGAMRKKWAGVGADTSHVLVFTDGAGKTQHGVAITVRQEIPLSLQEKNQLKKIVKARRRRRKAASRLCRWWKRIAENRMLGEALAISGCQGHSIEQLRADLSTTELKLLQENLRDASRNNGGDSRSEKVKMLTSGMMQWQTKSSATLKKMMKSPQRFMGSAVNTKEVISPGGASITSSSQKSQRHSEVESLTKNAIKRSAASLSVDGECASEITDDTDPSDSSADVSESKRNRLQRLAGKMAGVQTPPVSPRPGQPLNFIPEPVATIEPTPVISEWAREKGRESYQAMKHAARHGYACIMEKCYVLIGCRPDEHALLLGPLQQLVNTERKEINECRANMQGRSIDEWVETERKVIENQRERRHGIIEAMIDKLRLTRGQAAITFPRNHLDYIVGGKHYFQTKLPIPRSSPIKLPLPLPSIGKQWGLSRLLIDIGPDSLVLMLKLLLMERSILVLGENLQEVTACACSLLELLEPFEWSSVFLPVLPQKMLDFVMSPVPFVAGMAVNDYARVCQVEKDTRTLQAMDHGMSLLNLSTKTLHITSEPGISKMLSLDPYLREQLRCLRLRLQHLLENPSSSLRSFHRFIRSGASPKESITLDSCCVALEMFFSRFCGDLAMDCNAWKLYGTLKSDKFSFQPDWFMNRIRADYDFHEAMVNTQLFMGYVDERRRDQLQVEEMKRGEVGKFIASWVYERWLLWKGRNDPVEV